jgi:hypothetical protein
VKHDTLRLRNGKRVTIRYQRKRPTQRHEHDKRRSTADHSSPCPQTTLSIFRTQKDQWRVGRKADLLLQSALQLVQFLLHSGNRIKSVCEHVKELGWLRTNHHCELALHVFTKEACVSPFFVIVCSVSGRQSETAPVRDATVTIC